MPRSFVKDVLPRPSLSTPMVLAAGARAAIRAATVAAGSHEACGLLFGDATGIHRASVARNVAAEPWHRFEIDPAHLFDAQRQDRAGPDRLIGCWHSHPNAPAMPSAADRAGVTDRAWIWLIVSGADIRAWRPGMDGFDPVALLQPSL